MNPKLKINQLLKISTLFTFDNPSSTGLMQTTHSDPTTTTITITSIQIAYNKMDNDETNEPQ